MSLIFKKGKRKFKGNKITCGNEYCQWVETDCFNYGRYKKPVIYTVNNKLTRLDESMYKANSSTITVIGNSLFYEEYFFFDTLYLVRRG